MQEIWEWRIRVQGAVQGVGFRSAVATHATRCGIVGTVRNRPDGSVDIVAQGSLDALDSFLREIRTQPGNGSINYTALRQV